MDVSLKQEGQQVTGEYYVGSGRNTKLEGTIEGRTITLKTVPGGMSHMTLTLSEDGKTADAEGILNASRFTAKLTKRR